MPYNGIDVEDRRHKGGIMTKNRKFLALAAQIVAVLAILVTLSLF